ncbi:MAG TPA: diacylglycerol kinase family protein [Dehalococcoidia bacterium]|nr:diacylglycerol kinase family protein [Dehalococcoidia bacterium]
MERACIVYNRFARNAPSIDRLRAAVAAAGPGWQIDILDTGAPGHGIELAREAAASSARAVFACGGDGTVNEVVNGLAGTDCALGVLRGGMGNVFAKEVGISRRPERALPSQLNGDRRRFDLGKVNDRRFLLMAGVGIDAEVVRAVPESWKRLLGSTSYAIWALRLLLRYGPTQAGLTIDGVSRQANLFWLLFGNTRSYGGIADITGQALVDDGCLDAYLFEGSGYAWTALTFTKLALRRHRDARGVSFHRLQHLTIETPGLAIQADGEYVGQTPATFSAEPQALDVLLPKGRAQELFATPLQ